MVEVVWHLLFKLVSQEVYLRDISNLWLMKYAVLIVVFLATSTLLFAQTDAHNLEGPIVEVVGGSTFYIGRVTAGFVIEHKFMLKNRGSAPLAVDMIKSINSDVSRLWKHRLMNDSCAKGTITWPSKPIEPNRMNWVEFYLRTDSCSGPFYTTTWVFSNAVNTVRPYNGCIPLTIYGYIMPRNQTDSAIAH